MSAQATLAADGAMPRHTASTGSTASTGELSWNIKRIGSGPQCLLIHGTGASIHTWNNLVPLLAPFYTLILVDLPGHADTHTPENTDLSLPGITAAMRTMMINENIKPEMIIGHSAGAAIMMQLCLDHPMPDVLLVSINGAVIPLRGLAGYVFSPLARLSSTSGLMSHFFAFRARNRRNVKKLLDSTGSKLDQDSFDRYAELFQKPSHIKGVLRMMAHWRLEALAPRLDAMNNPTQLIAADKDRTIPLRDAYRLQQRLPNSSLNIIKGKGHLVHEEDPASVASIVLDYAENRTTQRSTQ